MQPKINAASIYAAALAAAATAPEYDQHDEAHAALCLTADRSNVYARDMDQDPIHYGREAWEAHQWATARAMEDTAGEWFHLQQLAPRFVTIQTSERGRHKVRNTRARLEAFAAAVKANQRAFGGGIKPTPRGARVAPSWPASAVRVVWEYLQDRNDAAALEAAEQKAGALFYDHSGNQGGRALMLWAPQDVQGLEGLQSARRDDGRWVVFEPASGLAVGACAGSRAAAEEDARTKAAQAGAEALAAAIARGKAHPTSQPAARAAWIKARGLEIEEPAEIAPAVIVATAEALAKAAAPAAAAAPVVAMAQGEEEREGVQDLGHAAGAEREGVQDLGGPSGARQGVQDLGQPAAREGVQDLEPAPDDREGAQDLEPAPAADAFLADIPTSAANAAFHGTSWNPERAGGAYRRDYGATLAADYAQLLEQARKGGTLAQLPDEFARYRAGYRARMLAWLASSSRCVSSWIAGPANFPAARMNKRADIAHRRMGELIEFRERALRAIARKLRPDLRPIMAGDADAADQLAAKIARAEALQSRMRAANAAIRKTAKQGEAQQLATLGELGFSESQARALLKPDYAGRIGFADYELTNNGANIRRMRQRLEQIERAHATAATEREGASGIRLEDDPPANRVRLYFPGKPAEEVRAELKAAGFRWAPSLGAWQGYRNHRTLTTARRVVGLDGAPAEREGAQDLEQPPAEREGAQDLEQPAAEREGAQDLEQPAAAREGVQDLEQPAAAREGVQDLEQPAAAREGVQDLGHRPAKAAAAPKPVRRRYVPAQGQRLAGKAGAWEAWLYRAAGVPYLVFYAGRAERPTAHHRYKTDAARWAHLVKLATAADAVQQARHARRRPEGGHGLEVGRVLVHSWGYEQTNVDFYQVTALVGRAMVEVRPIKGEKHRTGDMNGKCAPCPDEFTGPPMRRRAGPEGRVKVSEIGSAYPAEIVDRLPGGRPVYRAYSFSEWG